MSERSAAPGASAWKVALLDASRDGRAKDARVEVPRLRQRGDNAMEMRVSRR